MMIRPLKPENFVKLLKRCESIYCAKVRLGNPSHTEQLAMNRISRMMSIIKSKEFNLVNGDYELLISQEDWDAIHQFLD